jgi:hypothetical protein
MMQLSSKSCQVMPFDKNIITGQECFIMKAHLFIIEFNGLWYSTSIQVPLSGIVKYNTSWRKTELGMYKFQYPVSNYLQSYSLPWPSKAISVFRMFVYYRVRDIHRHSNYIPPNLNYSEPDQQCSAISLFPERGIIGYINHNTTITSLLITSVREQNLFSLAV